MDHDEQKMNAAHAISFDEFAAGSYDEWKKEAVETLKGAPFEKRLLTKTYEGITLEPIYTADHTKASADGEYPGIDDFTRGAKPDGYLSRPWTISQPVCADSPAGINSLIKRELTRGGDAFYLSCGIPKTLPEIQQLFAGVDLAAAELNAAPAESAVSALALLAEYAKSTGSDANTVKYHGRVGADPIGILAESGSLPRTVDSLFDDMAEAVRFAQKNLPNIRTIFIDGAVYHNGGACSVQELAYSFGTAIAYIDALVSRGLTISEIAAQLSFSFAIGANFFMEIAKFRAARKIWSNIINAYGGSEDDAVIDIMAETSSFTQTIYDPYVNILRATTQAFSGIVGGVSSLRIAPFDGALSSGDEVSRRIARNIQLMFQSEFDMLRPIDPAGGAWAVESLTRQLAEAVWADIQQLDAGGGILENLKNGAVQASVAAVMSDRLKNLALRTDRAVGVNMYANPSEKPLNVTEKCCVKTSSADNAAISVTPILPRRWTEDFELLRKRTEDFAKTGGKIKVFLANMGPLTQHKARADFSTGFMEVACFDILKNDGFMTAEDAAAAAIASGADVTIICSTDDTYPELVPPLAAAIKAVCPNMTVLLAGAPAPEFTETYKTSGVDDFIHVRANCFEILQNIQKAKGLC